jgi:hypothetical protein
MTSTIDLSSNSFGTLIPWAIAARTYKEMNEKTLTNIVLTDCVHNSRCSRFSIYSDRVAIEIFGQLFIQGF